MKILVPTAGATAAQTSANYIIDIAQRLKADVVALHIVRDSESEAEAIAGPKVFVEAGRELGVEVERLVEVGPIVETITRVAEAIDADLIVMGASDGTVVAKWASANVMDSSKIPVLVIPHVIGN